jgi:hypothetical protein
MTSQHPLVRTTRPSAPGDSAWQKIWLAAQLRDWKSLAIVPGDKGASVVAVAQALVEMGWQHRGLPIGLADLRHVPLSHVDAATTQIRTHVKNGDRVLIALGSVFENPTTVALAQAADCAILCVTLGVTGIASAEQTIAEIGRERFLGSLVLHRQHTALLPAALKG